MSDAEILLKFMNALLFVNSFIVGFLLQALYYVHKAARFLRSTAETMTEYEDNTDEIRNKEIPSMDGVKIYVRFEIGIALFVLCINLITNAFTVVPDAQLLPAWTFLMYATSIGTAYILISVIGVVNLKSNINVICSSYNITLNAYKFIDEANKEKKNDGTD